MFIENYFRRRTLYKQDILFLIFPLLLVFIIIISTSKLDTYWGTHGKKRYLLVNDFNYLNKKYNAHEKFFFFSHNINNNLVYKYCQSNINISSLFINAVLKSECIKNNSNDHLFYLEGNSLMVQYINLINSSDMIKNYYFKLVKKYEYSNAEINSLKNFYNKLTYVRTISSLDELKKFKENLNKFDKEVNFLIFGPHPFPNKSNTLECLIKRDPCIFDTDEDKLRREIDLIYEELLYIKNNSNNNFQYINVYEKICPQKTCAVYDISNNILIFRDKTHFNREGSYKLLQSLNSMVF